MRQYNPYTKYGRRKAREQAQQNIDNYTAEEKKEYKKIELGCGFVFIIIFIIVCILIGLIAGPDTLIKWLKS